MRRRPTVENVAEEILRELARRKQAGEQEPNIDTLGFLVSQKLNSLSQEQLDAGRIHLVQRRLIGKSGDRYSIGLEGVAYLATIDGKAVRTRRWAIGIAVSLAAFAAAVIGLYLKS